MMPHITISMYPGRNNELKQKIAKELENTMVRKLGFPSEAVSVSIEDIPKEEFDETINNRINDENKLFISSSHTKK